MRRVGPPPTPVIELPLAARRAARRAGARPRLDWGALAAGLAIAVATGSALSLLGQALGIGPATGRTTGAGALAAALWGSAATAVSLYAGGSATGHVAGRRSAGRGTLHGLVLWALANLFAELLAAARGGEAAGAWVALAAIVVGLVAAVAGARGLGRR